jgi:hypothetical protein
MPPQASIKTFKFKNFSPRKRQRFTLICADHAAAQASKL